MYKDKVCKMIDCECVFTPTTGNQKYCESCKEKAKKIRERKQWKQQSRERSGYKEYTRRCKSCGAKFTTHYKKKIYCGSEECEVERVRLKNKRTHGRRSKESLRVKNKKYYYNNREKCLQAKADGYRAAHPNAKEYVSGKPAILDISTVKEYIEERGYKLLSAEYINSKDKIVLECPEGHEWETTFHNFRDTNSDGGVITGARCMTCYSQNNYVSRPEQMVRDYLEKNYTDIECVYNDRSIIPPKELDFYFPSVRVGVEICGLYWHSEGAFNTPRNYHYNKMMECFNKGVRLITIFEDEIYNNFDVVMSRILQAINSTKRRIYARKCDIKCISTKEANKFFIKNHLQGKSTAVKIWGLFYKNELVSVCSVGKLIRKHTDSADVIELKRLCTLPNTHVIGAASKLFARAVKYSQIEGYSKIKSYCDMRYANIFNTVYDVLGFTLLTSTKYTPHYFKNGVRYRNYSLRKTPEERLLNKTEYQLRKEQGYDRIWDCGHRTYVYVIN